MDAVMIHRWISSLGRSYADLISTGSIPNTPLEPLFEGPGNEDLTMSPGAGLDLWFDVEALRLKRVQITLAPLLGMETIYEGILPFPLHRTMTRATAREAFGPLIESKGEWRIPGSGGKVSGGWDRFHLKIGDLPGVDLVVGYSTNGRVDGFTFQLDDR